MRVADAENFEALILSVLAGSEPVWGHTASEAEAAFLDACARHGVSPLVEYRLKGSPVWATWPEPVRRELVSRTLGTGLLQALAERDLASVLKEAAERGIRPLVLKGAALAHTHYPLPHLRPREDTDLLVDEEQREPLERIVAGLGYRRCQTHPGSLVLFQSQFTRTDPNGFSHSFDLHWRISNAHVFSNTFGFQELSARAVAAPALGEHAWTCCPVDALALACVHRVGHHANSRRLIWLHDIHLLAESLGPRQAEEWLELVKDRALAAVCLDGIKTAAAIFGGDVSARLVARLVETGTKDEPSAALLGESQSRLDVLSSDLRSVAGWKDKLRLAAQHLFPPSEFILRSYGLRSRLWLPLLYPHRAARGLWRILGRTRP